MLASTWAGVLVLAGVWAITAGVDRLPALRGFWLAGGVTVIAMGQFVYAVLVADRLFPHARAWVRWPFECATGLVYVGGLAVLGAKLTGVWP
jgi:hypothetical protein